jgi:uncharacterized protein YkwD
LSTGIFTLAGALFSLLAMTVIMIELSPASRASLRVTDITPSASEQPSPSASASQLPATQSPDATPSPTRSVAKPDKIVAMEDEVTRLTNIERVKAGCPEVKTDERIRTAARAHSADMAANNYFSHTSLDGSNFVTRMQRAGYPKSSAAAENIAYGYGSAQAVVNGWMNSEGHRKNMLNCSHKAVGNGLAYRGNTPYWTQDFGRT